MSLLLRARTRDELASYTQTHKYKKCSVLAFPPSFSIILSFSSWFLPFCALRMNSIQTFFSSFFFFFFSLSSHGFPLPPFFPPPCVQAKQRELEERCQALATAISLTQQEQIETCLTYRLFAVGQLHQRYRRLRLFFAQLGCRVGARESQAALLCGGESEAEERIKMVGVCLMLGMVEEACLKWTAVQNERQLVEGMNREVSWSASLPEGGGGGTARNSMFASLLLSMSHES